MANGNGIRFDWRALGLALFLVGHLGTALWFGGRISQQVETLSENQRELIRAVQSLTVAVGEQRRDTAALQRRLDVAERRLDRSGAP